MRLILTLLILPTILNAASDLAREQQLAEEAKAGLIDGMAVRLEGDGQYFLAIDTPSLLRKKRGAIILLHDRGLHPNAPQVIGPLSQYLPEFGWRTLSLQMPVLEPGADYKAYLATFPDALPRIAAGVQYLRGEGERNIILIAHGYGVHMAMHWIGTFGDGEFKAFIGIGMGATDNGEPKQKSYPLDTMHIPVLDIYGSEDTPSVIDNAPRRAEAAKRAGHPYSSQQVIEEANHFFDKLTYRSKKSKENKTEPKIEEAGKLEALIFAIAKWLNKLPAEVR